MKKTNKYTVAYRRKREGKTNYKKRLNILKSRKTRLVIKKTLNNVFAQLIEYKPAGDIILQSVHSKELEKYGWKNIKSNIPTAYLVGLLLGQKAKKAKITEMVLDMGFYKSQKGNKIYAVAKGIVDAGIELNMDPEVFPPEDRISGKHIADFKAVAEKEADKFKNQFSKSDVTDIQKMFQDSKDKIMKV